MGTDCTKLARVEGETDPIGFSESKVAFTGKYVSQSY